jgi:hypothetical protein
MSLRGSRGLFLAVLAVIAVTAFRREEHAVPQEYIWLFGGLFLASLKWLPYRGYWLEDLRPRRRRIAAGEARWSDRPMLWLNQTIEWAFAVGGATCAVYGAWLLLTS